MTDAARLPEPPEPLPSAVHWLTEASAVPALAAELAGLGRVALDTEFMREDTYHAQLALIQLGLPDRIVLVDPLRIDRAALAALLDAIGLTVLHSPGEDYAVLLQATGSMPATGFDTQVAAPFAGLAANLGLRELLRQVLGIDLAKDQTRSNWLKRPLSAEQARYAADDVRHLLVLAAELEARIRARGHWDWFVDECRRLRALGAVLEPDPQPHWQFKRADELDEAGQRRLYRLLHWREQRARQSDKPRSWIMPPGILWALGERAPADAADIERLLAKLQLPGGRKRAEALWQALQAADPALDGAFRPAPAQIDGPRKRRYTVLRERVEARAQALGLPPELLASRRLLEPLARDEPWPAAWRGWREQALGADFLAPN